jgi:hypothetical protein
MTLTTKDWYVTLSYVTVILRMTHSLNDAQHKWYTAIMVSVIITIYYIIFIVMLSGIMVSVVMLSVIMPSVVILSVVMLSVVTPGDTPVLLASPSMMSLSPS